MYVLQRESVVCDFHINVLDLVLIGTYGQLGWFRRPGPSERDWETAMMMQSEPIRFGNPQPPVPDPFPQPMPPPIPPQPDQPEPVPIPPQPEDPIQTPDTM